MEPFFQDFLSMSAWQRREYVRWNGLSEDQKSELLRLNRVIDSLIQNDCYFHGRMREALRKLEQTTRKHDGLMGG